MKPAEIQPPFISDGASHPGLYGYYLSTVAWTLRKAVAMASGTGELFDKDINISTPGLGQGNLHTKLCLPKHSNLDDGPLPCVVVFEGGGFILGEPNDGETLCRKICDDLGVVVLSLDYAKSPSYPFPHALLQGYETLRWIVSAESAKELGVKIDPSRIALLGKSAGGNLAIALSFLVAFDDGPCALFKQQLGTQFRNVAQILLYPSAASHQLYRERYALAGSDVQRKSLPIWAAELMETCYLPPGIDTNQIFVGPILADVELISSLQANLPRSAFFLAGMDCLKFEAQTIAESLRSSGVPIKVQEYPEAIHGFSQYKKGSADFREDDINDCESGILKVLKEAFGIFRPADVL